jgi:hypothetical protein
LVDGEEAQPRYVRRLFNKELDFAVESVNYDLKDLLEIAEKPA